MADVYLNWGGGLEFGPSNDLRIAEDVEFSQQRVIRRILNAPAATDENGVVTQSADYLFEQDYGAGLGRDVDGVSDAATRADREARIKTAMAIEPTVDQSQPVNVSFFNDPTTGTEFVIVQYTTLDGLPGQVGFQQ